MKRLWGLPVIGAVLGVALACASAQAQQVTVKIGILNDMSSVYADAGGPGSVLAAKMAIADFTATHKDIKVELLSADHQNKPDVGAAIARKWIDEDHVDVIMDLPNSAVALAVLSLATEKNRAVIGSGAGASVMTGPKCSKDFVHWTYDTYELGHAMGHAVTVGGGKTWYFISADYAFGKDLRDNCADAVLAAGGKIVGDARHPLNTADFSSVANSPASALLVEPGCARTGSAAKAESPTSAVRRVIWIVMAVSPRRANGFCPTFPK